MTMSLSRPTPMTPSEQAAAALMAATAAAVSMGGPFLHPGGGVNTEGGNGSASAVAGRGVTGRPEHLKARVKGIGPGLGLGQGGNGSEVSTTNTTPHGPTTSLSPPRPQPPPPVGLSAAGTSSVGSRSSRLSLVHPAVAMVVEQLKQRASLREGRGVDGDNDMGLNGADKDQGQVQDHHKGQGQGNSKDNSGDNSSDKEKSTDYDTSNMQALAMRMKASGKKIGKKTFLTKRSFLPPSLPSPLQPSIRLPLTLTSPFACPALPYPDLISYSYSAITHTHRSDG